MKTQSGDHGIVLGPVRGSDRAVHQVAVAEGTDRVGVDLMHLVHCNLQIGATPGRPRVDVPKDKEAVIGRVVATAVSAPLAGVAYVAAAAAIRVVRLQVGALRSPSSVGIGTIATQRLTGVAGVDALSAGA